MAFTGWRAFALVMILAAAPAFAEEAPSKPPPPASPAAAPAPAPARATTPAPTAPVASSATAPADTSILPNIDALVHVPAAAVPKPGQRLDVEAATQAYLDEIPPDAKARSDAYFEGGYILIAVDFVYALLVAAILLWGKVSANLRDRAQRITRFRWLQIAIYAVQYLIVATVLTLPLQIYEGFIREHQYGLSNQTFLQWAGDFGIQFAFGIVFFTLFLVVLYTLIRWTGSRWWIWGAAFAILFAAFQALIYPVFLAPALNHYQPLAQGQLREDILSMARANGVPADNVWEFDASRQSKRMSANVSGFLGTTRVSLNDNLLRRGSPAEVRAVMGHELGHYVLRHVWMFLVDFTLLLLIAFGFIDWAFRGLVSRFGAAWRVNGIDDPAGLPVILGLFAFLGFVGTPVLNSVTRNAEYQADIFGLNVAREPDGFAMTALKLSEYRKLDPTPWEEFIFYDHPSGRSRIHMAMQWKAENPDAGRR